MAKLMHLLLDLDGTLTDSFRGIARCINHALAELGGNCVPETDLRRLVGSPLTDIFSVLLASRDDALLDRAVVAYRSRFNAVGFFENEVFPGIPEALRDFRESGHSLQVVTAKPAVSAGRVLRHFALDQYFDAIHGPDLTERSCRKADLVLAALTTPGVDAAHAVMVGDRADDIVSARTHRVRAVAAGWGYGSRTELKAAGPDYFAETVSDLVSWVQSAG